jgi:hypothetical protein
MSDDDDDDETDDEAMWAWICEYAGRQAGISAERARAILEEAGFHAYGHGGAFEAIEIVTEAVRNDEHR